LTATCRYAYNVLKRERKRNILSNQNNLEVKKLELKIQSLKERFAKKMADYEDEIADIRAEATLMYEQMSQAIESQQKELNKVEDVPEED
jgi:ribosome-binding protein aMBF1 (putative translation factor)